MTAHTETPSCVMFFFLPLLDSNLTLRRLRLVKDQPSDVCHITTGASCLCMSQIHDFKQATNSIVIPSGGRGREFESPRRCIWRIYMCHSRRRSSEVEHVNNGCLFLLNFVRKFYCRGVVPETPFAVWEGNCQASFLSQISMDDSQPCIDAKNQCAQGLQSYLNFDEHRRGQSLGDSTTV